MRRLQAIALVIALMAAPMALIAGAWECACTPRVCAMTCCHDGKCMMRQHEQSLDSAMASCDCMRLPSFVTLAPLTQMILPHPAPMPAVKRAVPVAPALALAILPGFLPSPFHPPRG